LKKKKWEWSNLPGTPKKKRFECSSSIVPLVLSCCGELRWVRNAPTDLFHLQFFFFLLFWPN
jgi:hypothetical protein